ncbi:MAG TPA: efflux RND transporter permease subunit, partial [Marinilabiliaceae bacterium]|nr:efflux RND transporter permease subunit [Marinilabiliaceae bacterium]
WLVRKLLHYYEKLLIWSLKYKKFMIYSTLAVFLFSLFLISTMGRSFLPEFNEGSLTISVVTKPGTSLDASNKLGDLVEKELLAIPEIDRTARRTGRGELDEHSQSVNSSEVDAIFSLQERSRDEFMTDVRETLARIPGIAASVGQPLGHRIDHMLSGTSAGIAIKIFGQDLNRMFVIGNQIRNTIVDIDGLVDVNVDQQVEVPQIQIRAHRDMLAEYGISMAQFNDFVDVAFGIEKHADIYEGQNRFDLLLRLHPDYTETIEGIRSALIDTQDGKKVPLEQVAEVVSVTGPSTIGRENVQRKIVVAANVSGRDMRSVVEEIQNKVSENITLPEGYRIEYGGQFESEANASRTLMLTFILAIIIIFFILFQEFKSFNLASIILLNLPLALIGGVFSIYFTSGVLSIPAIIGFITLFGIATRNGILLVSNYRRLHKKGVAIQEIIIQGSSDRLNAILMTALTAALALIPLAVQGDLPGNEIQSPMAQVILGGLLTSTLLNIFIVPIVYSIMSNRGIIKNQTNEN